MNDLENYALQRVGKKKNARAYEINHKMGQFIPKGVMYTSAPSRLSSMNFTSHGSYVGLYCGIQDDLPTHFKFVVEGDNTKTCVPELIFNPEIFYKARSVSPYVEHGSIDGRPFANTDTHVPLCKVQGNSPEEMLENAYRLAKFAPMMYAARITGYDISIDEDKKMMNLQSMSRTVRGRSIPIIDRAELTHIVVDLNKGVRNTFVPAMPDRKYTFEGLFYHRAENAINEGKRYWAHSSL